LLAPEHSPDRDDELLLDRSIGLSRAGARCLPRPRTRCVVRDGVIDDTSAEGTAQVVGDDGARWSPSRQICQDQVVKQANKRDNVLTADRQVLRSRGASRALDGTPRQFSSFSSCSRCSSDERRRRRWALRALRMCDFVRRRALYANRFDRRNAGARRNYSCFVTLLVQAGPLCWSDVVDVRGFGVCDQRRL